MNELFQWFTKLTWLEKFRNQYWNIYLNVLSTNRIGKWINFQIFALVVLFVLAAVQASIIAPAVVGVGHVGVVAPRWGAVAVGVPAVGVVGHGVHW